MFFFFHFLSDTPPAWMDPRKLPKVEIYWEFEKIPHQNMKGKNLTRLTLVVDRNTEKRYVIGTYEGQGWDMREGPWELPEGAILGAIFIKEGVGDEITVWKPKSQKSRVLIVRYRKRTDLDREDQLPEEKLEEVNDFEEYDKLLVIKIPKFANVQIGATPTQEDY